jgi:serine protease Do/serine protease DegQ
MNIRHQLPAPRRLAPFILGFALLTTACRAGTEHPPVDLRFDPTPLPATGASGPASYADVIAPVQSAVVSVYSSKVVRQRLQVPDFFRQFYGELPERESRQEGLGSGVIVSKNGYILTNNHVVEEADELEVALNDGRRLKARLIGADPKTDIAVIKVEAEDLPMVTLADSDLLRVGDLVFAIGNPLGVGQTVTMGIVSATGRQVGILDNARTQGYENFIQTDAAINQGNSGGALIDARGRLIGINSAILASGRGGGNIGIGFAIPINLASSILTSLVETGSVQRGFLGIQISELKAAEAEALGLDPDQRGVFVGDVPKDSPAAKGGVLRADVILSVDGKTVVTPQQLRFAIASKLPGSKVQLRILRDGKERTLTVELGSLDGTALTTELLPGVTARPLDDEARRQLGADRELSGLIITEVAETSPYASRLAPGMVVVEINREPVTQLEDARRLLRPGRNLLILYVRGMFTPLAITIQ